MGKFLAAFLIIGTATSLTGVAQAQPSKIESASLESTTCWDFTSEDQEGRGLILMLHYGYVLGRYGSGVINAGDVKPVLTAVAENCLNKPDLSLVDAFKQSAGND